ncbi:MAG: thiamine pyrophosphate-binding protein [Deltaproteobacteria bacterium]|nr:thiamine pyrophosphate-binding protein [Deltaproteobacteria bacterium]MBW1871308.1 thiamine pyrophosphate-binding protein [Deltaproteobacteria bacterium]
MKRRGAEIVVSALEAEGVRFAFGIPGTHNIELYDSLEQSETIEPILVTDEQSASFMADAVSRTSNSIGVVNVVPGAGVTHCLSGVAEAFMDNIPMLVLTSGIRTDTHKAYQLHDIDQLAVLRPVTKAVFKVEQAAELYTHIRKAAALARAGTPGPVAVEVPVNFFLDVWEVPSEYVDRPQEEEPVKASDLAETVRLLGEADHPALYLGYGARNAARAIVEIAETLNTPVTTTIQGKGVFAESHPLWLWNGFGASAPGFVRTIMNRCDCLLAIGCRFGEVATASYGLNPPENLIHVDINSDVFNRNYPARLAIESDAGVFAKALLGKLTKTSDRQTLKSEIAAGHDRVRQAMKSKSCADKVSPAAFFSAIQKLAKPDTIYTTDSGNGTFLSMEHLRLDRPACFIGPVDFSCMGYAVPGAIGAKLINPERDVVALAGDGAMLMTGLELLTASAYAVAPLVCVLRDHELAQIVQLQRTSLNRDTCSVLAPYEVEHFAKATNCNFLKIENDAQIERILAEAFEITRSKQPVLLEVNIDYSQKTYFTKGVITTNFWRLSWSQRLRMLARAVSRRVSAK